MISVAYLFSLLGYLSKGSSENSKEKHLFYDLWTLIKGEESKGVSFDTIKTILFTIHGFYKGIDVANNSGEDSEIVYKKIGSIMSADYTKMVISIHQAQLIQSSFRRL